MSRRIMILRRELQNLKKQCGAQNLDVTITLDFKRSHEDIENLTGYQAFLQAVHEVAPDTPNWEWSKEQIQRACDKSGMCRESIISDNQAIHENITIQIHNRR